jgi:hypothetical protein
LLDFSSCTIFWRARTPPNQLMADHYPTRLDFVSPPHFRVLSISTAPSSVRPARHGSRSASSEVGKAKRKNLTGKSCGGIVVGRRHILRTQTSPIAIL